MYNSVLLSIGGINSESDINTLQYIISSNVFNDVVLQRSLFNKILSIDDANMMRYILVNINVKPQMWQLLIASCMSDSREIIRLLVNTTYQDLNYRDGLLLSDLDYTLEIAVAHGRERIAIILLKRGAVMNGNLLTYSITMGYRKLIKYLVHVVSDTDLMHAIKYSIDNGKRLMLMYLVHSREHLLGSALDYASSSGDRKASRILIKLSSNY